MLLFLIEMPNKRRYAMKNNQKVLFVDANTSYYRVDRFKIGEFFGPVDLGMHLSDKYGSLNIGTGLLAGSIFPGSNRLMFTGNSPAWDGFYISSMGGAGLVFNNLGINMLSLVGKAPSPSILYLNRNQTGDIQVGIHPIDIEAIWDEGRGGIYSLMQYALDRFGDRYRTEPRVLATDPSALHTDFGSIASVPIKKGELTYVDTWAGRGGFGSKMLQEHGIAAIIYGGSFIDEDFRDRKVADQWFEDKYNMKLFAKDIEATTKYKFDPNFETGGTFGVNFTTLKGSMFSFNYRSIHMSEAQRVKIHETFVLNHYLKQFNEETIATKSQKNCGEPCVAVCKKMRGKYKKDYEPYQTMGPLSGIFDQRAAEWLNHHADMYGFDAISIGGTIAWMMECLVEGYVAPEEFGATQIPHFDPDDFDVVASSMHNARIGVEMLDAIVEGKGLVNLENGTRHFARELAAAKNNPKILDSFVYTAFGDKGWMVPNQYWTPGTLSPMAIMGKYYMHYGSNFLPPHDVGATGTKRLLGELVMDNLGVGRFHRGWAEEMLPEIIESLFGLKGEYLTSLQHLSQRILNRNTSVYWESKRNKEIVRTFLERKHLVEGNDDPALLEWIKRFEEDGEKAAVDYWYAMHRGIQVGM
jgi:glyceraldehyde-3-phosphate dehydrogenase (ferredoxin)